MPIFDSANIARHLPLMAARQPNHPVLKPTIVNLLIVSLLLLTSCARYFTPNINLERYATTEEIVGTWHLLSSTLDLAKRAGYQSASSVHMIDFRADGTCDFNSIMETTEGIIHFSATGTWKLEHDTQLYGQRECKNNLKLSVARHGFSLGLTEENGKILLWEFLGDPDSWEFIKYEKRG